MWKWALITLCGIQAIWAAHHVVGYDIWSLFAGIVIALDIFLMIAVTRRSA